MMEFRCDECNSVLDVDDMVRGTMPIKNCKELLPKAKRIDWDEMEIRLQAPRGGSTTRSDLCKDCLVKLIRGA